MIATFAGVFAIRIFFENFLVCCYIHCFSGIITELIQIKIVETNSVTSRHVLVPFEWYGCPKKSAPKRFFQHLSLYIVC